MALRKAAHSLKGSSANVGARALKVIAAELEQLGAGGSLELVEPLLIRLRHEAGRTQRAFERELTLQPRPA